MKLLFASSTEHRKLLYLSGWIGWLASLVVGAGEFLVHYAPGVLHGGEPYAFFVVISPGHLVVGHYLIILGLPFYALGYAHLFLALRPGSRKLALSVFMLGVASFAIGGVWVGSRAFLGSVVQVLTTEGAPVALSRILASYDLLLENLVQILRILVLVNSALFVVAVLRFRTLYPRWMAAFNPALLLAIVFLLFFKVPAVGDYLAPTAMNVAHGVLFSASLWALRDAPNSGPERSGA